MITAFEALLLPTCVAVLLGLILGYGLESLIHMLGLLFPTSRVGGIDDRVEGVKVAGAGPHVGCLSKPAGCGRPIV